MQILLAQFHNLFYLDFQKKNLAAFNKTLRAKIKRVYTNFREDQFAEILVINECLGKWNPLGLSERRLKNGFLPLAQFIFYYTWVDIIVNKNYQAP